MTDHSGPEQLTLHVPLNAAIDAAAEEDSAMRFTLDPDKGELFSRSKE